MKKLLLAILPIIISTQVFAGYQCAKHTIVDGNKVQPNEIHSATANNKKQYQQCGGTNEYEDNICDNDDIIANDIDNKFYKCNATLELWEPIDPDKIEKCNDDLTILAETKIMYPLEDANWRYYYEQGDKLANVKDICKYSQEAYQKELNKCDGLFLQPDVSGNYVLCQPSNNTVNQSAALKPATPTDANSPQFDLSECANSGGMEEGGKCECDANKHLQPTTANYKDKTYAICKCVNGYKRKNDDYKAECIDAGETTTEKVLDTVKMAQNKYNQAHEREQSLANKALTAGTTAATGLGGMTAASALAEQNADREAEADMRDYLATFKCEYGNGQQKNAGNEEITLPGGNELLEYYTEYKTLADSVKQTKGALGLRAGIESETLYDRAQSGLYQYSVAERAQSGQISLARALSDETSADAAAWNEQKAQTASNLKTGLVATATGVVSGIVGNQLINRKYKNQELKEEFKEITHRLEREHPQIFMPEPIEIKSKTDAITMPEQQKESQEKLKLNIPSVSGAAFRQADFELNSDGKEGLDAAITQIIAAMNNIPNSVISIHTIGHTDMQGISAKTQREKGYKTNQELSEKRSKTVNDYLKEGLKILGTRVHFEWPTGQGDTWCRKNNKAKDDAQCRRVDIEVEDLTIYTE